MDLILPFKVGDTIELRSFLVGYRGAWFRCKIIDMYIRNGHMDCQVEYMDYPEEKRSWSRLYQIPPKYRRKACQNRELMLRPSFPHWCWDDNIPEHGQKMDDVAVVSFPWKVGDLVDWWYNCCFWTGKIIELLGDDKVKIACPEEPFGEGGCYDADLDDLRPALDWSLEKGWSAPLSQENGESWYTARLITKNPDTSSSDEDIEQSSDGYKEVGKCLNGSLNTPEQKISKCLNGASVAPEIVMDVHPTNTNGMCRMKSQTRSEEEPQKCTDEKPDTSLEVIQPKAQPAPDESDECCTNSQADFPTSPMTNSGQSSHLLTNGQSSLTGFKRLKTSTEHASVQSPAPGTVGEAWMDVEKLAHKIRRAEDLLQPIDDAPSSRAPTPSWRFYR